MQNFYWEKRLNGYVSRCKSCFKEQVAKARRKRIFGIEPEEYERLLEHQNGVCAVCEQENPHGWALSVDHDHVTGKVRGLLCVNCNTYIARLGDNLESVLKVVAYLEAPPAQVLYE